MKGVAVAGLGWFGAVLMRRPAHTPAPTPHAAESWPGANRGAPAVVKRRAGALEGGRQSSLLEADGGRITQGAHTWGRLHRTVTFWSLSPG